MKVLKKSIRIALALLLMAGFGVVSTGCHFRKTDESSESLSDNAESAPLTERDILIAFYKATDGDNWTDKANWCTDAPLESWYGLILNKEGRVETIDMSINNISGAFPESFWQLTDLRFLWLDGNNITGTLAGIENLTKLVHINFSHNQLGGILLEDWMRFDQLRVLVLDHNQFVGPIPESLGFVPQLRRLDLSHNNLTGSIPGNLVNVMTRGSMFDAEFRLDYNYLSGEIPVSLRSSPEYPKYQRSIEPQKGQN